jgi:hypothetical protein
MTTLLLLSIAAAATAAVQVISGPTPIELGEARSAGDITVVNEKLAFALAVGSPVPYGVPRGALIDLAPVVNGRIGRDCVVFADFIPNDWSAWPNTLQRIEVLEKGPDRVSVRTQRDWGKVLVTSIYTLESGADAVHIETTMSNGGAALPNLLSGLTLWPKRGFFFGVPGAAGQKRGGIGAAGAARVVAYDEDWSVALHAPYADRFADNGMDLYEAHSLAAGETRRFEGWLQVGSSGDLKPVVAAEIERRRLPAGTLQGAVLGSDGASIENPVVIVEAHGAPYAWALGSHGRFALALPAGKYQVYATAKGYSQSARAPVELAAGTTVVRDFSALEAPGSVHFEVVDAHGAPLDARIRIASGQGPAVGFLGRKTFFTALDRKGNIDVTIAPGDYRFAVASGAGFVSREREVAVHVDAGRAAAVRAVIARAFDPRSRHWYAADLHHHADQAEAVTPPADLARSQLAAGLDVLFVSDHDSSVNHAALETIAARRGVPFIAAMELSASWGHFNAYPLTPGAKLGVDTGTASVQEIFKEARRLGARVIQVNHPFIPYGYFSSVASGTAPGGFDPGFDLMEINAEERRDDSKVLHALWDFWNRGQRYYLAAGTDTHDVWRQESGEVRSFAYVLTLSADSFVGALKAGHAYVTYGPLVYPSVMFGDTLRVKPGQAFALGFDFEAAEGLKRVDLIEHGRMRNPQVWPAGTLRAHVDFPLIASRSTWYALIVEDVRGRKAYTDPIWVEVAPPSADSRAP